MERIEELPKEFQGAIQNLTALMGLAMAYRERYGDESLQVLRSFGEKMGAKTGNELKQKGEIKGSEVEDLRKMMELFTRGVGVKLRYETEANKLRIIREAPSLCPMIFVSKALKIPLRTVCENLAFPRLRAIMKTVNPNVKHTCVELGEQKCVDELEI